MTHYDKSYILHRDTSMVSCQKGLTRHAYAWQIGPFWQDTLDTWCHIPCSSLFKAMTFRLSSSIRPHRTQSSKTSIKVQTFSFKKRLLKILSERCRPIWSRAFLINRDFEKQTWDHGNYIIIKGWYTITHLCPNFNGGLNKLRAWVHNNEK